MGIDLRLYPLLHEPFNGIDGLCDNILSMNRNDELFEKIRKLPSRKMSDSWKINCYGPFAQSGYGNIPLTDPYGDWVGWVYAKDLWKCVNSYYIMHNDFENQAICAYLRALPDLTKIILWWH